eukprot:m51a1_g11649 hypothetical protein (615) ;mRNA; f:3244-5480
MTRLLVAPGLLALVALCATCSARPVIPDVLGSSPVVDPARPNHYEFSSSVSARRSVVAPSATTLEYSADLRAGVHSIDSEMSVEALSCGPDFVDLAITDDKVVRSWGTDFVLLASPAWGCAEGAVSRRVVGVEWSSTGRTAHAATRAAAMEDIFDSALVHLSVAQPTRVARGKNEYHWNPNMTASWNKNAAGDGAAVSPYVFSKLTCDVGCTGEAAGSDLCSLCPAGVELKSVVDCTDCWVSAGFETIDVTGVQLEIGGLEHKLMSLTVTMNATAEVEVGEAGLRMAASGSYVQTLPIFNAPIYGTEVNVVGKHLQFGAFFDLSAVINISKSEAAAHVGISYSKVVDLSVSASIDSHQVTTTVTERDGRFPNAVRAASNGHVAGSIGLRPSLSLRVADFGVVEAWAQPTVSATAQFSYPAFGALTTADLVPDGHHFGRCDQPHLLEYAAGFSLPIGGSAKFGDNYWPATFNAVAPMTLASGCLFNLTTRDPVQQFALEFSQRVTDVLAGLSERALSTGLGAEIARALRLNVTDVVVGVRAGSKLLPLTVIAGDVTVSRTIGQRIKAQAAFGDSALWSGPLMSRMQPSYVPEEAGASTAAVASLAVAALGSFLAC